MLEHFCKIKYRIRKEEYISYQLVVATQVLCSYTDAVARCQVSLPLKPNLKSH